MKQERTWLIATRVAAGAVAVLLLVLLATGVALTFNYQPDVSDAYANVTGLEGRSFFSVRSAHQVASNVFIPAAGALAIASIGLFLVRRNRAPIALSLLVGVSAVVASITGYLLPWDQLSLWAVTVGTNMRGYRLILERDSNVQYVLIGSRTITPETFTRFYWLHAALVPIVIVVLVGGLLVATRRAAKVTPVADDAAPS